MLSIGARQNQAWHYAFTKALSFHRLPAGFFVIVFLTCMAFFIGAVFCDTVNVGGAVCGNMLAGATSTTVITAANLVMKGLRILRTSGARFGPKRTFKWKSSEIL